MAHACGRPKLSGAFESALALAASRLNGSGTDGPTAPVDGLVVHPAGMGGEIVLLAHHHLARLAFGNFQSGDRGEHFLLASMPQSVAEWFGPLRRCDFILPM